MDIVEEKATELFEKVRAGLPGSAAITDIRFEGCEIILYTKSRDFFTDPGDAIKVLVGSLKKRIILRPDPSLCTDPEEATEAIKKVVPAEAGIRDIEFEPEFGKVTIEADKPGLVIGKGGETLRQIKREALWSPVVKRAPAIPSDIVKVLRELLYRESAFRKGFLDGVGKRIHGGWKSTDWVRLTALGGFREVGRSAVLIQTPESRVLLDCGLKPGTNEFPYLAVPEFDIPSLNAIVLSHAHMDHCLPPDTPVVTESGLKAIDDIVEGDTVMALNRITGKITKARCTAKSRTEHKILYRIKTTYHTIRASPNHRFFVVEGLELKELEAAKLKQGMMVPTVPAVPTDADRVPLMPIEIDPRIALTPAAKSKLREARLAAGLTQVAISRALGRGVNFASDIESRYVSIHLQNLNAMLKFYGIPEEPFYTGCGITKLILPESLDKRLAQCIGYLIGDGHKGSAYSIRMTDASRACLAVYAKLFAELFNYNGNLRHHSDRSKNAELLAIDNVFIARFLERNFSELFARSRSVRVPEKIKYGPKAVMAGFLRGIADAEGSIGDGVKISSSSPQLLEDMQFMFSCLGIPASLSYRNKSVSIASAKGLRAFRDMIGFSHPAKQEVLERLLKRMQGRETAELMPLSSADLKGILKETGMLGRIHGSPRISELPSALVDLYRRKRGYAERGIALKLLELLEKRASELQGLREIGDARQKRKALSLTARFVAKHTGVKESYVVYSESGGNIVIENFLNKVIDATIEKIKIYAGKLRKLMNMTVSWERIERIDTEPNRYRDLVDIEVEPHENFIAGNIVVHNSALVPYLYKMGCDAPLYSTAPTRDLMVLLCMDYLELCQRDGRTAPYSSKDIKEAVRHCVTLEYDEVNDVTPDMRLTLLNAGHILGSAISHLHIGEGLTNVVYTGDLKFDRTALYEPASTDFGRAETVLIECTYGSVEDVHPRRAEAEGQLVNAVKRTIERRGKVLIPSFAVERSQDVQVILAKAGIDCTVWLDGMVWDATAIHTAYPEFMNRDIQRSILQQGFNPFTQPMFKRIGSEDERRSVLEAGDPAVIIATAGMLTGGPSVWWLRNLADNAKNSMIFVGYQSEGSLGRRIQKGWKEIPMEEKGRTVGVPIKMEITTVEGLSGHSDHKQLINWLSRLRQVPERILVNHGENAKCAEFARAAHKFFRCETAAPKLLETIRLK